MDEHETIEGSNFVIKDNRSSQTPKEGDQDQTSTEKPDATPGSAESFDIDFSTFALSLTSSAFYHLGDIPDPTTGKTETNLPAVKQTIDMLIMLKQKTEGNLTADEAKLLEQLIYELQIKYVEKTKR